jgi:23S rRNA pseudouridine1911/1915/1917 synthase
MSHSPFIVSESEKGQTLAAILKRRLNQSWSQIRRLVEMRSVRVNGQVCTDASRRLRPKQRVDIGPNERKSRQNAQPAGPPQPRQKAKRSGQSPALVYLDEDIVVVEKPLGLTTMRHPEEAEEFGRRGKRFLPPTLADLMPKLVGDSRPVRAVHRLDKDTTGLVVFARTPEAERHLGKQFRGHTIARKYLALARGRPMAGRIESWLIRDRGDGRRGSGPESGQGQRAVTHVTIVEELGPFTLIECRLETGRTHQVRIHLGEHGTPLCGETVYDRPLHGAPQVDESGAPRIALHAAYLGLRNPKTERWLEWESPLPDDLQQLLETMRKRFKS